MEMPLPGSITACSLRTASGPDVPVKPQSRTSGPDALGVTPTLSLKTRDDPCGRLLPGGGDGGMISVTVPAAASAISGVKSTLAMESRNGDEPAPAPPRVRFHVRTGAHDSPPPECRAARPDGNASGA